MLVLLLVAFAASQFCSQYNQPCALSLPCCSPWNCLRHASNCGGQPATNGFRCALAGGVGPINGGNTSTTTSATSTTLTSSSSTRAPTTASPTTTTAASTTVPSTTISTTGSSSMSTTTTASTTGSSSTTTTTAVPSTTGSSSTTTVPSTTGSSSTTAIPSTTGSSSTTTVPATTTVASTTTVAPSTSTTVAATTTVAPSTSTTVAPTTTTTATVPSTTTTTTTSAAPSTTTTTTTTSATTTTTSVPATTTSTSTSSATTTGIITTSPVETRGIFFLPEISSDCLEVESNRALYIVTWECTDARCASCGGDASYVGTGGVEQRCFRNFRPDGKLELTYASCNALGTRACAYKAVYPTPADRGLTFNNTNCTTGWPNREQDFALNENGDVIEQQGQPQNIDNWLTNSSAPFEFDRCYTANNNTTSGASFRSYKLFCSVLPAQYSNLNVTTQLDQRPPPPPAQPTIELKFYEPIAPECSNVTNGFFAPTYMLYWIGFQSRSGVCGGAPEFIARGDEKNCFQGNFPGVGQLITTTYLSCNAAKTKACAWSADFTGYNGFYPNLQCVTTGCSNCTLYDGSPIPADQLAPIPRNNFGVFSQNQSSIPAPFDLATCYQPPNPTNLFRSYQVYCNFEDIPAQWRNLPVRTVLEPINRR